MDKSVRDNKAVSWYNSLYSQFEESLNGDKNLLLQKFRDESKGLIADVKFPTMKDEEWKYTNVNSVLETEFKPAAVAEKTTLDNLRINENLFTDFDYDLFVFHNGEFDENLSSFGDFPKGVIVSPLKQAMIEHPALVEKYLNKSFDNPNAFNHLNNIYSTDGFFIYVPDGKLVEKPIQVVYLNGDKDENILASPHNLFVVGENAGASVLVNHFGANGKEYFNNVITEVFVAKHGNLNLYKVENEDGNSFHIERTEAKVDKEAVFSHYVFTFGGRIIRNDLNAEMTDEFAETNYYGLYLGNKDQHIDNHTFVNHASPNCESNELYKGILDDNARGVFTGKILVERDAQKTNAYQSNKAILMSETAHVDTKPQLEIYADDVKCSHGATIGHLDETAYFYIRSRGVPAEIAKSMLIRAFADDVVEKVKIKELRDQLNQRIFEHLHRVEI